MKRRSIRTVRKADRERKRRHRAAATEAGMCSRCLQRPAREGRTKCETCAAAAIMEQMLRKRTP